MKRKIAWFILLLINIGIILAFTLQNPEQTHGISDLVRVNVGDAVSRLFGVNDVENRWWYNLRNFRRLAHIPEYFLLGVSAYGLCGCIFQKRYLWLKVLLGCLVISLADELLKGILPTREFDFLDMLFDFVGYFGAIVIVGVVKLLWC
jgi:VanZ family protein